MCRHPSLRPNPKEHLTQAWTGVDEDFRSF